MGRTTTIRSINVRSNLRKRKASGTLKNNNSSAEDDGNEEEIPILRYPKRNVPKINYSDLEAPDDDQFICEFANC